MIAAGGPPADEIAARISAFQAALGAAGLTGALIVQRRDLFYLTGTAQDAHLVVPAHGEPRLLVRRSGSRARQESPLERVERLDSMRDLPGAIRDAGIVGGRLGLELDVLPAARYLAYARALDGLELDDCSPLVRSLRSIKSAWELEQIEAAARQVEVGMRAARWALRAGITEIELAAEIEHAMRNAGHQGVLHARGFGFDPSPACVLGGPSAAVPGGWDAPIVGPGPNPAIGAGSSERPIESGETVIVDLLGGAGGYVADATRTFATGEPPEQLVRAHALAHRILTEVSAGARPGVTGEDLFLRARELAGDEPGFMGVEGENVVSFVGHGLGLEVDEPPFLARGFATPLAAGMVFALEPKFLFAGVGAVGVENSFVVEEGGARSLIDVEETLLLVD